MSQLLSMVVEDVEVRDLARDLRQFAEGVSAADEMAFAAIDSEG